MLGWAAHERSRFFFEVSCITRAHKAVHYEQSISWREEEQEVPLVYLKWRHCSSDDGFCMTGLSIVIALCMWNL